MYNPNQTLKAATVQELWTALLLKRRFNRFEPNQIVQSLYAHPQLWQKCWLGWEVFDVEFYQDTHEAPIARLLDMLVYAEDERLFKNDVLYIQSAEDDAVPALLELGKQWRVDSCEVYDRTRLAAVLGRLTRFIQVLGAEKMAQEVEQWKLRPICAPVVAMWWD